MSFDRLEKLHTEYRICWDMRMTIGVERVVAKELTFTDLNEAKDKVRDLVGHQEVNEFYNNKIENIRWSEREVFASPWNTRKV